MAPAKSASSASPFLARATPCATTRSPLDHHWITTDPATLPPEATWDLMTNQPGKIEASVGNTFGLRTWIAYGCKHAKDDLGWTD